MAPLTAGPAPLIQAPIHPNFHPAPWFRPHTLAIVTWPL